MKGWLGLRQTEHERVRSLLSAYIDGRLDTRERAGVDGHLRACAACRADLATLQATLRAVRAAPVMRLPRSFTLPRSMARQPRPSWAFPIFRTATAVTAVLLAIVMAGDLAGLGAWMPGAAPALAPRPDFVLAPTVTAAREVALETMAPTSVAMLDALAVTAAPEVEPETLSPPPVAVAAASPAPTELAQTSEPAPPTESPSPSAKASGGEGDAATPGHVPPPTAVAVVLDSPDVPQAGVLEVGAGVATALAPAGQTAPDQPEPATMTAVISLAVSVTPMNWVPGPTVTAASAGRTPPDRSKPTKAAAPVDQATMVSPEPTKAAAPVKPATLAPPKPTAVAAVVEPTVAGTAERATLPPPEPTPVAAVVITPPSPAAVESPELTSADRPPAYAPPEPEKGQAGARPAILWRALELGLAGLTLFLGAIALATSGRVRRYRD